MAKRPWLMLVAALIGAGVATVVVLAIVTSGGSAAPPPASVSSAGVIPGVGSVNLVCPDCDDHGDIHAGASVVIVDGNDNVLGSGVLAQRGSAGYVDTAYPFFIGDLPAGKGKYGVKVGGRSVVWEEESEVADHGFLVKIGS